MVALHSVGSPVGGVAPEKMIDLKKEWSISFAGCGFMGIYYVGATSCILERFPRFIHDASKIYGASAGALMAAVHTAGVPLGELIDGLSHSHRTSFKVLHFIPSLGN